MKIRFEHSIVHGHICTSPTNIFGSLVNQTYSKITQNICRTTFALSRSNNGGTDPCVVSHSHGSESSWMIASNKSSFMSMLCAFSCPGAISNSGDASSYHARHIVSTLTARSLHLALTLTPPCSHSQSTHAHCQCAHCALTPHCSQS